jgi:hypothetical protein
VTTSEWERSVTSYFTQHGNSDCSVQREVRIEASNKNIRKPGWGFWLTAKQDDHGWHLIVDPSGYTLSGYTWRDQEIKRSVSVTFSHGHEAVAKNVFNKFLEWEAIAASKDAEPFEKVITQFQVKSSGDYPPYVRTFTFAWRKEPFLTGWEGNAVLRDSNGLRPCYKHDVICFAEMVQFLPEMNLELMDKIRNQEAQKNLFK